ncbi:hypothetical protein C5E08_12545 [Rathayibacter iranicus]|uniref:PspC domain-containing protein n=3 Tax=Rathayibacter iranicus TaxID=59737 RepID=A0AAD1ENN1_9MICO|nr:PspC domain-containing protein [Rathayibacter iranicus]PPI43284.1 hypothetical protein C5E09_11630 [Rathayibacter iranicus]PPI58227.1 hypothetical protein C5E08_12545 [Rathayibacter iranicus]PPI69440.1 hypothetical protein C5E01_11590 [Rathayibacter iranicus]
MQVRGDLGPLLLAHAGGALTHQLGPQGDHARRRQHARGHEENAHSEHSVEGTGAAGEHRATREDEQPASGETDSGAIARRARRIAAVGAETPADRAARKHADRDEGAGDVNVGVVTADMSEQDGERRGGRGEREQAGDRGPAADGRIGIRPLKRSEWNQRPQPEVEQRTTAAEGGRREGEEAGRSDLPAEVLGERGTDSAQHDRARAPQRRTDDRAGECAHPCIQTGRPRLRGGVGVGSGVPPISRIRASRETRSMTAQSTTAPDGGSTEPDGAQEGSAGSQEGAASGGSMPSDSASEGSASAAAAPPAFENRFVLWLRGLDLPRQPGWIGGVCAGIADRLGIDPLIVRGIVIVVAVLGGPALLFYAAAWLLLPDQDGALPVERLLRGSFDRIHAAIGALVLASMLPMAQGFWSLGGAYTGAIPWSPMTGRTVWSSGVLALIVAFIIWIVRRSARSSAPPPATVALQPTEPLAPQDARPSSPEAVAEWRERQAAWRAEREAFRAQQSVSARETARVRGEEARRAAAAITAARLERRRLRRAARPRLRASLTLLALGAAALTGALVSLTVSGPTATVVGFATAALVLGVAIVLAAVLKRRAILLIAFSVVALLTATSTALLPTDRTFLPVLGSSYMLSNGTPGRYSALLASDLHVRIVPGFERDGELDLWVGVGHVSIEAMQGTSVRIETTSEETALQIIDPESGETEVPREVRTVGGRTLWTQTFGDPAATPFVVRITQESGSINVYDSTAETAPTTTPPPDTTAQPDAGATTTTGEAR